MTVALFIGIVTIGHLLAYAVFVYWTTRLKASGNAADGEIIDHTWDGDLQEQNHPIPAWVTSLFYIMIVLGSLYLLLFPGVFGTQWNGLLNTNQINVYDKENRIAENKAQEYYAYYDSLSFEELVKNPEALNAGRRIFLNNCALCHASDAGGIPGSYPNLTDHDWLWGGTPENIIATVTNGRNTIAGQGMVAGGALPNTNPETLADVSEYILQLGGHTVDTAMAERGKALYEQSCIACHGAKGEGNIVLGGPNLTDDIWLYTSAAADDTDALRAFLPQQIMQPKNHTMPAWKDLLGESRIRVVSAYVYSLSHDESAENTAEEAAGKDSASGNGG